MRTVPTTLLTGLCAFALLAPPIGAQAGAGHLTRAGAKALRAFEAVAEKPEARRRTKLSALARYWAPEITTAMLSELRRARTAGYRRAVIGAIGRHRRPGVLPTLLEILDDPQSSSSLCYAVAAAIGKQGAAALPELLKRLRDARSAARLRRQLLRGLAAIGTPAAYDALIEEAGRGTDAERYVALQNLRRAPVSERLTRLRLVCFGSSYQPLKFQALQQLAEARHPETKALALATFEAISRKPAASSYASQLAAVLAGVLDADTFEAFVVTTAAGLRSASAVLERVGATIDAHAGFVGWLIKKGPGRKVPAERAVAIRLLTFSDAPEVGALLLKLVASRDPGLALPAIRALGERGDPRAVAHLRRAARARNSNTKVAALLALHALHALLRDAREWRAELLGMLRTTNLQQKVLAVDLLADLHAGEALPQIHELLTHKAWQVRAAAYDFCRLVRNLDSVDPLIARVDAERGRLREDCLDALKSITSYRLWDGDRWRKWWSENRATFEMPTLEQALPKKRDRAGASTTSAFFDIPLVSTRPVFVIDVSGSMSAEIGSVARGGKTRNTRIREAQRQLARVIGDLPGDAIFNLISFETRVKAFSVRAKKATKHNKAAALASVMKLGATGGTNIHDALELAFQDDSIDTIYLLSDGGPSAGKITDPRALGDEVARWNKTRRLRIHTIAIGAKSALMERLAKDSGGVHSHVR